MKSTIELAAEFIRRAAFVDANALLKDECGVEGLYKSREEFRKWSGDYILGFFESLTARHSYVHPRILGLLGKEKNDVGL